MEIKVSNMSCNHCKMTIEKALKEANISDFNVDLDRGVVYVGSDELSRDELIELIRAKGYDAVA